MKKLSLHIIRPVRNPFYQVTWEMRDEKFIDEKFIKDEYRIVWEEAEAFGMSFTVEERVDILKSMKCVACMLWGGIYYFYCRDAGVYWEELANILDRKQKEEDE
ncbi:hypothetical protein BEP19_01635 [Ammoniphilus oxalaticus]|uniref:Uncharacterized protein n=1 Tax=Ammoniphilus oxalaticus TaxID=66863 RepID=A0A419SMY5_9BACL|nr:hypothetical protein [Ammoniphilus oxalaticus]RKD25670.1 hypothetical protein BEP19_01635 [Ammoniphilus oxalaticus]